MNSHLFDKAVTKLLSPLAFSYKAIIKASKKTKNAMPYIYNQVESLVKSHIISLERNRELLHDPDIDGIAAIITNQVIKGLPHLDEKHLNRVIKDRSSKSFLDLLTRGLGSTSDREKDYSILSEEKKFKSILIANRGEIALRIIRACMELGIRSIVIYSKSDKDSLAVKFADKAYNIGSNDSYLNLKKIIKTAKKARVDAIHPGYGFLAENAGFAELCNKNKITFIGPSVESLKAMGNKARAKELMIEAGIPVVEGTITPLQNKEKGIELAGKIGYPIILKAVAGGGGRGMRIVTKKGDLEKAYEAVKAEAKSAFNDDSIYIEKYIEKPMHIEFQILADKYGNIVHLGERECSIQRRHQKLIEIAPSPILTSQLREIIGNVAIKAAKTVGYEGAGTVEFLGDKNGKFYFIEMNARIQVEHGITEMITGVDLVKEQIKLAAGAKLAYNQSDIEFDGFAIECRINAENPAEDFKPSVGTISNYIVPGGPEIRVCSSCHVGHVVNPYYDSLISKLMCKGKTREEAIARTKRALNEYIIEGVETTIPFHQLVLSNENFVKGNISTSFIEDNQIIEALKKNKKSRKNEPSQKEKVLIVSTAVSKYLENRPIASKSSLWVSAGRQELMSNQEIGNQSF